MSRCDYKIICLCEGNAERAIMDILIDNGDTFFTRKDLVEEKVHKRRSVENFQKEFLRRSYKKEVVIIRILDSLTERFNLKKAYKEKVHGRIDLYTRDEIEILIIIKEGLLDEYYKHSSNKKSSEICKQILNLNDIKSYEGVKSIYSNPEELVEAINEYNRKRRTDGEDNLTFLFDEENVSLDNLNKYNLKN